MQLRTYAVADKFAYHRVIASFDILLHRGANIAQPVAGACLVDCKEEAFACRVQKLLRFHRDLPAGEGPCVVAVEALVKRADVNRDDVALLEDLLCGRYAVDHHMVYRNAGACRKIAVTEKAGHCPCLLDRFTDDCVELERRNARADGFTGLKQCLLRNLSRIPHAAELAGRFQVDHAYASTALSVRAVVSATSS